MTTRKGILFIIAAPSGAGKTSLVKGLVERVPRLAVSVSHTTRAPRPGEIEGQHYFFVDENSFDRMIEEGAFLEHAKVFGQWYGTSLSSVKAQLDAGIDVILEIDWQGAAQVRAHVEDTVSIFIFPPSLDTLRARLCSRKQDTAETINARMAQAKSEIRHYREFDYLIVNDDFDHALSQLAHVVGARRVRADVQCAELGTLISQLLENNED